MEGGSSWLGGVDWTSVEDATQCPVPLPPPSRSIEGLLMQAEDMISEGYAVVLLNIDAAGTLFVTNFRLIFVMGTDAGKVNNFGTIPLATIEKFGKQQTVHSMSSRNRERLPSRRFLQIVGKDMRTLVFGFRPHTKQRKNVFETLTRLLRPLHLWGLYAFSSGLSTSYPGGNPRLRLRDEYLRIIGLHKESYQKRWWTLSDANADYNLCSTYPSMFMMPSSVSDEEVQQAAAFRVRGRFPVLCWQHPENGAVLARSSQPRVGIMMNSRSTADEKLVAALCPSSSNGFGHRKLYIADARPRKNALANGAMGGGSESSANYLQCEVVFLGIDNIHAMRDSLARLRDYLDMHGGASSDGLFSLLRSGGSAWVSGNVSGMSAAVSALGDSGWLVHVHSVLAGAAWIAARVSLEGASVLVHCSDGWDRTTQLVSLASLLLDPYYRTFQGFQVLVEKDWLAFGHPFADRLGMPTFNHSMEVTRNSSTGLGQSSSFRAASGSTFTPSAAAQSQGQQSNNYSPIFLQWIDCVSQLIRLYPHAFEFTSAYLVELLDCILSCRFGNFLCNSEKERLNAQVWDSCGCLWKYLEIKRSQVGHQHQHFNVFYKSTHHPGALLPPAAVLAPVLWPHFYLRWVSYGCAPCFEQGGELEMQARAFYHRVSSAEKERDSARSQVKELVAAMRVMAEQVNVERQAKLSAMSIAARYQKQAAAVKHAVETMGCKIRFTRPGNHGLDDDEAEAGNDSSSEATARESGDEQQLSICVSLLAESDASGSGGDEVGGLVSTSQAHAQTQEEEVAETNHLNGCREGCNWPHTACARLGSTLVGLRANFDALENLSILDRYFDIT